jgi:hypothetical protein
MDENSNPPKAPDVFAIPTIDYYEKMYGKSLEGNDQKGIGIFKTYEPKEKHRRLQHELQMIRDGRVSEQVLDQVVKLKRKMRHQGYESWAQKMMIWFAEKKV